MGVGGIPRAAALPLPAPESGPDKAAGSALARRSLFTSAAAAAAHRGDEAKKATTQVGRQVREPRAKAGALKFWA